MMQAILDWLRAHPALITTIGLVSLVFFVGSLLALPFIVARIPTEYFAQAAAPPSPWARRHPTTRVLLHILKNVLGVVLLLLGVAMLVLPGQGLLTMLVGLILIEGPGKRRIELWAVRIQTVRRSLDWLRARRGAPPLVVCEKDAG